MDADDESATVARYRDKRSIYKDLAATLAEVLGKLAERHAPGAIVQSRAKTVASFAEKVLRKGKYGDPISEMTDLAGARVVAYTLGQVAAITAHLEREPGIEIDRENSGDTRARLKTGEFGYRAMHYVLRLKGPKVLGIPIEAGLRSLKAEVQVCTMLQHVWAAIGHDRVYKTSIQVPEQLKREISGVAALLETCDARFASAIEGLDAYIGEFDAYLSPKDIAQAIERWRAVHAADPSDEEAIHSMGRLLIAAGRFREARECLLALKDSQKSSVLCDLGRAAWRVGEVAEGPRWLERATALDPKSLAAHCELGASVLDSDPAAAREHYAKAFALAPDDPRVLAPYVECHIVVNRDTSALAMLRGTLRHGIEECVRRIDRGVCLPESYLERARLHLYEEPGQSYTSLHAYCKAIVACASAEPIEAERRAVERLIDALRGPHPSLAEVDELKGFDWVQRLLVLGSAVAEARSRIAAAGEHSAPPRFELSENARTVVAAIGTPAPGRPVFKPPIVIVAGGCAADAEAGLRSKYGYLLQQGFADFEGTIICGGTTAGISGMVADLRPPASGEITKIAYLPEPIPATDHEHRAYTIYRHPGRGYSPLGPIQTWADLLLAGIDPSDVRVFGVNGGDLSAFEYRLALAMGARVGIVERSGRAASDILPDVDWQSEQGLAPLPEDWATVSAFVCARHPIIRRLSPDVVDAAAQVVHQNYQASVLKKRGKVPDRVLNWEALPRMFNDSNRNQVAYSMFTLRWAGFDVVPAAPGETLIPDPPLPPGYKEKVEAMAEREHGRYVAERLADGWRRGDDNASKKTNPTLMPWEDLSEETKDDDRRGVRGWVSVFAKAGWKVVPRRD